MSEISHGVYTYEKETSLSTPVTADVGIPFVVGTAPFGDDTTATAGTPVYVTSWSEAEEAIGYDDDWETYTLCEFMYSHFKLYGMSPVIFLPLASGATTTEVAAAFESVDLCQAKFSTLPDLLLAPGFSDDSTVRAVMAAKAEDILGMFKAKAIVDLSTTDYTTYTEAIEGKNAGSWTSAEIVCWPMIQLGDYKFHLSTALAGLMAQTDSDNEDVPYEAPSNKTLQMDGACLAGGTEVALTQSQANTLNGAGIVTALNLTGWVAWGNYTAVYPSSTDVKDYFIPISRMFGYVAGTLIKTFWSQVDKPMNKALVERIIDSANIWLNGLVGMGALLGARVVLSDENTTTSLMAGIIKFHVYITPPSPAQEIDFTLEYDTDYVESYFSNF